MVVLESESFRSIKIGDLTTAIKYKKLTGTTAASEGGTTAITHNLTMSKVISFTVLVVGNELHIPHHTANVEREYDVWLDTASVNLKLSATNSGSILSKPITVLITYEEG